MAAQAEAQNVMDNASFRFSSSKKARQQFRNQVSDFALHIAGKIVHNQMQQDDARDRLVDSMLDG